MSRSRSTKAAPKRWPDVMIGVLTLALLGGFGALLLEQGKPHPVAVTPQPAETNIPASPGTVPEPAQVPAQPAATAPTATPPAATPPATTPPAATAPTTSGTAQTPTTQVPATQTPASQAPSTPATTPPPATAQTPATTPAAPASDPTLAQTQEIPPAPKAPEVAPITPPVVPQTPAAQTQPATPSDQTATTPATPTASVPARSGGAVAVSANRTPLRSDYRISLGSFGSQRTAETQTANVRSLGYTVHSIDLGDQYVAQIGPFADEATARQALADIQRAYPSALLYRPRNAAASTTESAAAPSSTSASGTSSAASTSTTRPQAAAPSGPTYLQVGAFDRIESAQNLVGQLKEAGFAPTVNNPPDRKTTVMVGPYSGDALLRAETRLDNAGLEHFRVR